MTAQLAGRIPSAICTTWQQDKLRVRLDPFPCPFALLMIVGFLLGVEVQFIGTLYLGEVLLAMFACFGVFLNLGNFRFWTRDLYWFLIALAVTFLAYITTDIFLGTETDNLLRGWARNGFLITDVLGMYVICRKNRYNLFPIFLGLAVSEFVMPHNTLQGDFAVKWKFDLAFSWVSSVCVLAGFFGKRRAAVYAVLCLIPVSVISIVLDSRLIGAICMAVAFALLAQMIITRRQRKLLVVVLLLAGIAGGLGTYFLLNRTNEEYGERRQGSNVARATAILTALQHIGEHPFQGTGSWTVSEATLNRQRANTTTLGGKTVSTGMALGHSQILQAAVEAGIFGSAFFIYFLVSLINAAWWVVKRPLDRFSAFAMFNVLLCIWHCLFSPQGGSQRIGLATGVSICLLMAGEKKMRLRTVNRPSGRLTVRTPY